MNLLMRPQSGRFPRPLGRFRAAVADVLADVRATVLNSPAPAPAVVSAPVVLPPLPDVVSACEAFAAAADDARAADRAKRKARKLLDALPVGRYGAWIVSRTESSRSTVDLGSVRATYARLGLGEVPMKAAAPSLKVERAGDSVSLTTAPLPSAAQLLAAEDACPLCGYWRCRCGQPHAEYATAVTA